MFTGIIEEIGTVKEFNKLHTGAKVRICCSKVLEDTKIGDSISINGCCQTVTEIGVDYFAADVSEETLKITNFLKLKSGDKVNLERALTPTARMGGHIVQGHIDGIAKVIKIEKLSEFYNILFEVSSDISKYIVKKGSVAVNGISLTVTDIADNIFTVAVIPHTYSNTVLNILTNNDLVNIETDILGRYVEKILSSGNNRHEIDEKFLIENGFM